MFMDRLMDRCQAHRYISRTYQSGDKNCDWSQLINIKWWSSTIKGGFLLFLVYRNFDNLFSKLSVSTFYKEISKFQQKVQS